jgi:hypothetical protein
MIIDAHGHILLLAKRRIAGEMARIEFGFSKGLRYPAKLVGTNPETDLVVVIHIAAKEPQRCLCDSLG